MNKEDDNKVATPADRLQEVLSLRNMKPSELSELSGVNRPSISCYLSGKYDPKQKTLYNMARALDVNEMWLAGYDVPMDRSPRQKDTDAMLVLTKRMRKEKEFRELILKINTLNPRQLETIRFMVSSWDDLEDHDLE